MKRKLLIFFATLLLATNLWADVIDGINYALDDVHHTAIVAGNNSLSGKVIIPATVNHNAVTYSVVGIKEWAFVNDTYLDSIIIGENVTSIGENAFLGCTALKYAALPNSLTTIEPAAFSSSGLLSITIPNSVTVIKGTTFTECSSLVSVNLGNGLTTIEDYAFSQCSALPELTIPSSVTSIGNSAFASCDALEHILVNWTSLDGVTLGADVFGGLVSATLYVPLGTNSIYAATSPWSNFNIMPLTLMGKFSISATRQVSFATSNLQYQASTNTWRFSEHQYDYVGNATLGNVYENSVKCNNGLISSSYSGWIDLFGWGTSGNSASGTAYQPWATTTENTYYGPAITDSEWTPENSDWGVVNANQLGNGWYTPSKSEWKYVFEERPNAGSLRTYGSINGVNGTILLPDEWVLPAGQSMSIVSANDYTTNVYSTAQWTILENAGAVFFPSAGVRDGTSVSNVNTGGFYASSTARSTTTVNFLRIGNKFGSIYENNRYSGRPVRLAHELSPSSVTSAPTAITGLTYTGSAQALVNAGTASGGTIYYSLNNSTWSESVPTATNAGNYTVYYKVVGDAYHKNLTPASNTIPVTIAKASFPSSVVITPPTPIDGLVYNASNQSLVTAGSATGGFEMVYALGTDGITAPISGWSTTPSQAKPQGDYYVWYKASGGENYEDSEPDYVVAQIAAPPLRTVTINIHEPRMGSVKISSILYSNDFESGFFDVPQGWTNDATYPWVIDNGRLKSGNAGVNSSSSVLRGTVSLDGEGSISFHGKISSEESFDFGRFYIDGVNKLEISGNNGDGQDYNYVLSAGVHEFQWEYAKDVSVNEGDDAFYIDNLEIRGWTPVSTTPTQIFNGVQLELIAIPADDVDFSFVNWTDETDNVLGTDPNYLHTVTRDITINANFVSTYATVDGTIEGALPSVFSVSEGRYVYFSSGNLQYKATTDTWRFAQHQYESIGGDNTNISPSYDNWIDLFGWGTGDQPTKTDDDNMAYDPFVDWGINAISNGGNINYLWRTLSYNEWNYLLNSRPSANSKRGRATVDGKLGYVLLPDDWTLPDGLSFTPRSAYSSNIYTTGDWAQMETNGAVFLPCGGYRENDKTINHHNEWGSYWSSNRSNHASGDRAWNLFIADSNEKMNDDGSPKVGEAVRLVTAINTPLAKNMTYNGLYQNLIIKPGSIYMEYKVNNGAWSTSVPQAKDAGEYTITCRKVGETDEIVLTSTIIKAPLTITADNKKIAYGAAAPTYTATYTGFQGSDNSSVLSGELVLSCSYTAGDAAGAFVIIPSGVSSSNYVITFVPGVLTVSASGGGPSGQFSVSSTTKVDFSSGNLQYQASTGTWRFAEHQYDFIGNAAGNTTVSGRDTQADWIDYFGWGTSGYNSKYPWQTSYTKSDYAYASSGQLPDNYDWGKYNASQLGDDWRTLTADEWVYLFNSRTNASSLLAGATINGSIRGIIVLPDDWVLPAGSSMNISMSYTANSYTTGEWEALEDAGAIFLPFAGYRGGTSVMSVNDMGRYWTATAYNDEGGTYVMHLYNGGVPFRSQYSNYNGMSVRLVKEDPTAGVTTPPTARTGLIYDGTAQTLIIAGTASNGTMEYQLGNGTWSTSLPQATDPGYYVVSYRVKGNSGYADYTPSPNTVLVYITPITAIPLTFEAKVAGATVTYTLNETKPIQYSTDGSTWNDYDDAIILANVGDKVSFRGNNTSYYSSSAKFQCSIEDCYIYGNIMSLVDADNYATATELTEANTFRNMFYGNTHIKNHPTKDLVLPATTLTENCYLEMFLGCEGLTRTPALPATTLASDCYTEMFRHCTGLTSAPALPATTLANNCYDKMFYDCTSLTNAPALPATTLADECYQYMFYGCTGLTSVPANLLPATTLASSCYSNMFKGCTNLSNAPALPATTLANYCYSHMFHGCSGLTSVPALPATTLASGCYNNMFFGCEGLTTAPALPATTLASGCYVEMFRSCTGLATAPVLPATTLVSGCYERMFCNCSSLSSVTCMATTIESPATDDWLYSVKATGTFYAPENGVFNGIEKGPSSIPEGWNLVQFATIDGWKEDSVIVRTNALDLTFTTATIYTNGTPRAPGLSLTSDDAGIWSIPASLNSDAGKSLRILFYDNTTPVSCIDTVVPYVVSTDATLNALSVPTNADVQVVSGTLTVDADATIAALDIYPDAKAVVETGHTLTTTGLIMRADGITNKYPQLVANGHIINANYDTLYYDYALDNTLYYPLAVPYNVPCSAIRTRSGHSADYGVMWYNGADRAANASGWTWLDDVALGATLQAGQGYIVYGVPYEWNSTPQTKTHVRFPMKADLTSGEQPKTVPVSTYGNAGTNPSNLNWNFIGQPYMATYRHTDTLTMQPGSYEAVDPMHATYTNDGIRYVTTSTDGYHSYTQMRVKDADLLAFHSYFIQVTVGGDLTFDISQRAQNAPIRRATLTEDPNAEIAFGLVLSDGTKEDRTGLLYGESFTDAYELNADLVKMFGSAQGLSLYSLANDEARAFNALAKTNITNSVPLGFRNAEPGELTIAFDSTHYDASPLEAVWLTDNEAGMTVNLLEETYRFTTAVAQNNTRFSLYATLHSPQITTNIESTSIDTLSGDGVYDILGRRVTTNNPPAGVYIIIEKGQKRKEFIR